MLLKRSGEAYLFKIVSHDPYAIFYEEFEGYLYARGWKVSETGIGSYTLACGSYYTSGERGLELSVIGSYAHMSTSCYSITIEKKIVAWSTGNLQLSIYINMSDVDPGDTIKVCIWSSDRSRRLIICNPGSWIARLYPDISFPILNGTGSYTFNLSSMWYSCYGSELPGKLILSITCDDGDGTGTTIVLDHLYLRCGTG